MSRQGSFRLWISASLYIQEVSDCLCFATLGDFVLFLQQNQPVHVKNAVRDKFEVEYLLYEEVLWLPVILRGNQSVIATFFGDTFLIYG